MHSPHSGASSWLASAQLFACMKQVGAGSYTHACVCPPEASVWRHAGKKKLLRKAEHRNLGTHINTLSTLGDRIYVGDLQVRPACSQSCLRPAQRRRPACLQESFFVMKYKKGENVFYCAADEAEPRHVTAGLVLDYDTVAGADKFGNAFVLRLQTETSLQVCLLA